MVENSLQLKIDRAKKFAIRFRHQTQDMQLPVLERDQPGLVILQLTLDHADGIVLLIENELRGVAATLVRVMFDFFVTGYWLLTTATNEQVETYINGVCPKTQTLVTLLNAKKVTFAEWIKENREKNSPTYHNLTHAGNEHYFRSIGQSGRDPKYLDSEMKDLLDFTFQIQTMAAKELLEKNNNEMTITELIAFASDELK